FAQQRLWFLDRLEPGSPFYNITRALRLHGHLDVRSLGRALGEIVRRHEALRTTFPSSGGFPAQVIAAAGDASLSLVDLGGLGTAGREAVALDLATLWARSPFDLARGPLLRLGLLRLGEQEHLLLAAVHHSVADGWSMGVLVREIGALYAAFVQGEPSPLPELPVQYADFAAWQRSWLQGEVLEEQIAFWRGRLAGAPRVLELPADRPRPPVQTFRGAVQPLVLPPALAQAARGLGRRESATLFMTLLAAWAVLLGRHAGQEDLLVGTPIAGRNRREIEDLVGFFVNTLVLRIELSAGDSGTAPAFLEVLGRVRAGALTAFAHQDLPFERLVEELAPERDLSRSPLFQVLFSLQNAPAGELRLPGLTLAPVETGAAVAKFDLSLYLVETGAEITGGLEHNRDLFDAGTVERLGARFAALLAAAVADPGCPVGDLPLLSPAEVEQLVTGWNDTAEPFPADLCVHERIAAQAARTPEAVALSFGGEPLFYQELVERAGRLARRLVRLGVGPDVPVGLCADRSPALLVGVLGILQAGGAYVPLDPTHPRERLGAILADSGLRVLVTENALLGTLPHHGVPLVLLDGETAGDGRVPLPRVHPENLAYVLFTSGSTGRSKGVAVSHRGVMNFLTTLAARAGFSAGDVVVALTTLSFDIAVTEL
ncbi:MAG TPA: non-ribosomal peptide synthetase, partial [Acidobacteria bacterium]|nr:non-ribosomal peptide synthetase [Acidobacteriota bacterium]